MISLEGREREREREREKEKEKEREIIEFSRSHDIYIFTPWPLSLFITGAFCAIDFFRSKLHKEGIDALIDVKEYVMELRRQRPVSAVWKKDGA